MNGGTRREKKYTSTVKAYKNSDFLGSSVARNIRILCEYEVRPMQAETVAMQSRMRGASLTEFHIRWCMGVVRGVFAACRRPWCG